MNEQDIINQALTILEARLRNPEYAFSSPTDTFNYLNLKLADLEPLLSG